jgi:hypothetical protein
MINLGELIIVGLAANRFWSIWLASELTKPLRDYLSKRGGWIGYLSGCPFCLSVWAGFMAWGCWQSGYVGKFIDIGLAAGLTVFVVEEIFGYLKACIAERQTRTRAIAVESQITQTQFLQSQQPPSQVTR